MDVSLRDYDSAIAYLFARTTGAMRFGLERTRSLLHEMDDPHLSLPTIHVAGTNGKGSAVATAEALLRARGLRVGRYTSPHLIDFRERIVVGGEVIAPADVIAFVERWLPTVERIGASFFEATTAMALDHFSRSGVDVAVVETGLGGRLDSTNVVQPLVAGVTSIGIDHTEYLGSSLESIAREKAGIFKRGSAAVIGEGSPEIRALLAEAAAAAGSSPVRLVAEDTRIGDIRVRADGTSFTLARLGEHATVRTPLVGRHQAANFAFALALVDAAGPPFASTLSEAVAAAPTVHLPGRFQRVGRWIFDVAHNPDGAATVAETIREVFADERLTVLICVLGDKDWRRMLDVLAPVAGRFILTDAPSAPSGRRWALAEAMSHVASLGVAAVAEPDFSRALARAEQADAVTVVTGSFHTVGDAMACLQVSPLSG